MKTVEDFLQAFELISEQDAKWFRQHLDSTDIGCGSPRNNISISIALGDDFIGVLTGSFIIFNGPCMEKMDNVHHWSILIEAIKNDS